MILPKEGMLLRVFIGEKDKWEKGPLYEKIVQLARKEKMAGATVLKGFLGFGSKSHMHTSKLLRLSEDLPIIIEIIDTEEKITHFLPLLDEMIQEGLVTLEKVNLRMIRKGD